MARRVCRRAERRASALRPGRQKNSSTRFSQLAEAGVK
jgi:cob(I)alamin adenosyltransferase